MDQSDKVKGVPLGFSLPPMRRAGTSPTVPPAIDKRKALSGCPLNTRAASPPPPPPAGSPPPPRSARCSSAGILPNSSSSSGAEGRRTRLRPILASNRRPPTLRSVSLLTTTTAHASTMPLTSSRADGRFRSPRASNQSEYTLFLPRTRAAVISAMTLLETTIRRALLDRGVPLSERISLGGLLRRELISELVGPEYTRRVDKWRRVRNRAVHTTEPVEAGMATELVHGAAGLTEKLTDAAPQAS